MTPQLYVLHEAYAFCAQQYADQHIAEALEVLPEVLRAVHAEKHPLKRHVLTKWATGPTEYSWLYKFVAKLAYEAEYRFGVVQDKAIDAIGCLPEPDNSRGTPNRWLQLLPPEEVRPGHAVYAYRMHYLRHCQGVSWTRRAPPGWWLGKTQLTLDLVSRNLGD